MFTCICTDAPVVVTTILATIMSFRGRMPKALKNNVTFAFSGRFYKLNHGVLKVTLCFPDAITIVINNCLREESIPTSFHGLGDTQVSYPLNIGTANANTKTNGDKIYSMFTFVVNKLLHDTRTLSEIPRILRVVLTKQLIFWLHKVYQDVRIDCHLL